MNFDQRYKKPEAEFLDYRNAKKGWNACKKEILSLMEERSEKCCGTKAVELDRMMAVIRTVV